MEGQLISVINQPVRSTVSYAPGAASGPGDTRDRHGAHPHGAHRLSRRPAQPRANTGPHRLRGAWAQPSGLEVFSAEDDMQSQEGVTGPVGEWPAGSGTARVRSCDGGPAQAGQAVHVLPRGGTGQAGGAGRGQLPLGRLQHRLHRGKPRKPLTEGARGTSCGLRGAPTLQGRGRPGGRSGTLGMGQGSCRDPRGACPRPAAVVGGGGGEGEHDDPGDSMREAREGSGDGRSCSRFSALH